MMAAKCRRVKLPCFGRMPRPAEWPALVLAASLVSTAVLDRAYALRPPGPPRSHVWRPDDWPWEAAWSLPALVVFILLITLRRRIPPWARSLGLVSLAIMWLSARHTNISSGPLGPRP
jgi:hypothetical protein